MTRGTSHLGLTRADFHKQLALFDSAWFTLRHIGWLRDPNRSGEIPDGYVMHKSKKCIVNDAFIEYGLRACRCHGGLLDDEEPEGWLFDALKEYRTVLSSCKGEPVGSLEKPMSELAEAVVPMLLKLINDNAAELQRESRAPIEDLERKVKRVAQQVAAAPKALRADDPAAKALDVARSIVHDVVRRLHQMGAIPEGSDDEVARIRTFLEKQTDRRPGKGNITIPAKTMLDAIENAPNSVRISGDGTDIRKLCRELDGTVPGTNLWFVSSGRSLTFVPHRCVTTEASDS